MTTKQTNTKTNNEAQKSSKEARQKELLAATKNELVNIIILQENRLESVVRDKSEIRNQLEKQVIKVNDLEKKIDAVVSGAKKLSETQETKLTAFKIVFKEMN